MEKGWVGTGTVILVRDGGTVQLRDDIAWIRNGHGGLHERLLISA